MAFPQQFIDECKEAFPDWKDLHEKLDQGSDVVGRYLDDSFTNSVKVEDILAAKSLDEVQAMARREQKIGHLYAWWYKMVRERHP